MVSRFRIERRSRASKGQDDRQASQRLIVERRANQSIKLTQTQLSPRSYLGGWGESEAGQREILGQPAAQLSSDR